VFTRLGVTSVNLDAVSKSTERNFRLRASVSPALSGRYSIESNGVATARLLRATRNQIDSIIRVCRSVATIINIVRTNYDLISSGNHVQLRASHTQKDKSDHVSPTIRPSVIDCHYLRSRLAVQVMWRIVTSVRGHDEGFVKLR
jgi:hypothetical protein